MSDQGPYRGDIRLTKEYPPGTKPSEITEFEIWDGSRWVPAAEAEKQEYLADDKKMN